MERSMSSAENIDPAKVRYGAAIHEASHAVLSHTF